jgi:hypothetical protein
MFDLIREIKDTPTPSLLVAGGMIFLVLAVAGRIMGKVEVPPQHQRTAGAIGVLLLLGGIALQLAPALLRPLTSDPIAASGSAVDTSPAAASAPATALPTMPVPTAIPSTPTPLSTAVPPTPTSLPTAVPPTPTSLSIAPPPTALPLPTTPPPQPTALPLPTTPPAQHGRSPEDSLRDYWRAVSEQRYADAWPMLSANFRWTTHSNDFEAYVHGYEEQGLCSVAPDDLAIVTETDDYAQITATMIYRKGADCAASPLGLVFHMVPADGHAFWRIDRVDLR